MDMTSNYAENHKREPKPEKEIVTFRLESDLVTWVDNTFHNKSAFYQDAIKSAIKKHKRASR